MFASPADWVSPGAPGGYDSDPPAAGGEKVVISDTDHLGWVISVDYVWRCFTRAIHVIDMDHKHSGALDKGDFTDQDYDKAMGHVGAYADRVDLAAMTPHAELASTKYCLAKPGSEYVVYQPRSGAFDLTLVAGDYRLEWFNPATGDSTAAEPVRIEAGNRRFTPPFGGRAVLYVHR